MSAKQLVTGFLDAPPLFWDRSFVKNLREIRGFPNWWRIRDDESYIDGPPQEGEQYTKEQFNWKGEIRKDAVGDNLDTIDLFNLAEFWEYWDEELADGSINMYFKYTPQPPKHTHVHTALVDSVSIEFDQLGRRVIAFESEGDVYLLWYDSQAADFVVTNFGAGYNPQIVTDTYRRTGGSADSTRYLFYVDVVTKQIVYRAQLDRFGVVYTLPNAPSDVVELLKVSKNLYGGLTALYSYEESPGKLSTGSFTAKMPDDKVDPGTDGFQKSSAAIGIAEAGFKQFILKVGGVILAPEDLVSLYISDATLPTFFFGEKTSEIEAEDIASVIILDADLSEFSLKSSTIDTLAEDEATISITDAEMKQFSLKETLIPLEAKDSNTATITITDTSLLTFSLG